jgi:acyl carrier protein
MDSLLTEVQDIFRAVFDQPDLVVVRESNAATIDGWDSLAHINLIVAIEKKFQIKLSLSELQDLKDAGDIIDLIHTKLKTKQF